MTENQSSLWSANEEVKKNSNLEHFSKYLDKKDLLKYSKNFKNLWKWSVNNPSIFWKSIWDFTKVKGNLGKILLQESNIFFENKFSIFLKPFKKIFITYECIFYHFSIA